MKRLGIFVKGMLVQTLLWLALLLAMGASLSHVAYSFNQFELVQHQHIGWLAGIGVDLGLLCLAIGIQKAKRQKRGAFSLWLALAFVTGISVLANVSHGVHVVTSDNLSAASFATFDWVETGTMLLLAGCLPVLVFALTEVAAGDTGEALEAIQRETKKLERERQQGVSTEEKTGFPMPIDQARDHRKLEKEQAVNIMLAFFADNPNASHTEAAQAANRSRSWVTNQLKTLEQQGVIDRNGDGIEVLVID